MFVVGSAVDMFCVDHINTSPHHLTILARLGLLGGSPTIEHLTIAILINTIKVKTELG